MSAKNRLEDQSGTALVVALVMIVVLTFIGLTSMFTATFETSLSGNKRLSTDAFYAAETRTNSAAKAAPAIHDEAIAGDSDFTVEEKNQTGSDLSDNEKNSGLEDQRISRKITIEGETNLNKLLLPSGERLKDKSTVTIYRSRALDSGAGLDQGVYIIDTVGTDRIASGNNSKIHTRMKVVVHRPTAEESQ